LTTTVATLGQLVAEARKHELPVKRDEEGRGYYTLVFEGGRCWLEETTDEDLRRAKEVSPKRDHPFNRD
jgi:hypothetical protein